MMLAKLKYGGPLFHAEGVPESSRWSQRNEDQRTLAQKEFGTLEGCQKTY